MKKEKNLADFLKTHLRFINDIFKFETSPTITYKEDGSPVTTLDLKLSSYIEELFSSEYPQSVFYSEEKFSAWAFPLLALDPLDGTSEYINGNPEWAISIGHFPSENFSGDGWVYNPALSELFERGTPREFAQKENYLGEVSRSEWKQGLFNNISDSRFSLRPVGSIAYKLGRLSQHDCDFVISLRPKNIWDIAGGTLLCQESGIKFYSEGKEVVSVQKLYLPPLIWCHPSLFSELSSALKHKDL